MFKLHPFLAPAVALAVGCVACGAAFTVHDGNGASAGSGNASNAGETSGGFTSSGGSSSPSDAGEVEAGGTNSAGQGSGEGGTGTGGTITANGGRGNWSNGGWWNGSGGRGAAEQCAAIRSEYDAAVAAAKVCDKGSTDQCSASSVVEPLDSCGCAVPVNAKSEATATAKMAYQAYQDAHCEYRNGTLCDSICSPIASASCGQQSAANGSGFVCTSLFASQR